MPEISSILNEWTRGRLPTATQLGPPGSVEGLTMACSVEMVLLESYNERGGPSPAEEGRSGSLGRCPSRDVVGVVYGVGGRKRSRSTGTVLDATQAAAQT